MTNDNISSDTLFPICPVCTQEALIWRGKNYRCGHCGLTLRPKTFLGFKSKDKYIVQSIGKGYNIARSGIAGRVFSLAELKNFGESIYTDQQLAAFAAGNFDELRAPSGILTQILLEQLRETVYVQTRNMRRARGPAIEAGGNYIPEGLASAGRLTWRDKGNLFLTNARLIFPSNSFTFIRMDRKLIGLKTFENGFAVQRKGEDFATYFIGCRAHQAALNGAYIMGRLPALRVSSFSKNNDKGRWKKLTTTKKSRSHAERGNETFFILHPSSFSLSHLFRRRHPHQPQRVRQSNFGRLRQTEASRAKGGVWAYYQTGVVKTVEGCRQILRVVGKVMGRKVVGGVFYNFFQA